MQDYRTFNYAEKTKYSHDEGLKQYFLKIYGMMSAGLAITATMAFLVFSVPALTNLLFNVTPYGTSPTGLGYVVTFAPLGIGLYFFFGQNRLTAETAQMLFWVYAALVGASLAGLGFMYTGASIASTFFICSGMFAGTSIYGYTTKKDLTSFGSFLIMGLIGLILASLVNAYFQNSTLDSALSVIGVFVFTGLIAWDTQKLKTLYYQGGGATDKLGIVAAFTLYLDFINLFIYLLRILGVRRGSE